MTTTNQTHHFPCGPCPLEDDLTRSIQHYTTMIQNLRLFSDTTMTGVERTQLAQKIILVDGILARLQNLYALSQEAIKSNKLEARH